MNFFLGSLAFVITAVGSTVPVVSVPSPIDKDAVFETGKDPSQKPTGKGKLVASSKDGARIVVGESVMVTGTHSSKIHHIDFHESGSVRLSLENGGFLVHVGSKPVILELGEFEIEATSAFLAVVQKRGMWFVKALDVFSNKKIMVRYTAVNQNVPLEAAVDPVEPLAMELESKKTFSLIPGKDPMLESKDGFIATLIEDLKEPTRSFTLKPHDVEDPADIAYSSASAEGDMTEIEIEAVEIEIEADCIEVCMD